LLKHFTCLVRKTSLQITTRTLQMVYKQKGSLQVLRNL